MTCRLRVVLLLVFGAPSSLMAHSASDAYLNLSESRSASGEISVQGQWDIALRDLDFVLKLDDNGDGKLTWGEVRRHRAAIENFAYQYLSVDAGAQQRCVIKPKDAKIDNHADGAYMALFFDISCAPMPRALKLHYNLFFSIDPSHRGIFVMRTDQNVATALLSPDNATIDLAL